MKTLTNYLEAAHTKIFNNHGAFFAFSDEQFEAKAKKGVRYCSMSGGLICPKDNAKQLNKDLETAYLDAIKKHKSEHSKEEIILAQIYNHECYYTWNWSRVTEVLEDYGYTDQDVETVFRANIKEEI